MRIQTMHKIFLTVAILVGIIVIGAPVSRVTNFSDGEVLTASQLNSEFNNVIGGVNSINNAQIATNAAIAPSKIAATIKGDGINRNGSTGTLSVKVDGTTLEISGDNLKVKDSGVDTTQIADNAVTSAKILDGTIATADIADNAVTLAKGVSRQIFLNDGSTYLASGLVGYNQETNSICNSTFCGGTVNSDTTIRLNVSGTRPVVYMGHQIPGTSGGVTLAVTTLSPVVATGEVQWSMVKEGGSTIFTGTWLMTFKADSNNQSVSWPCSALSTVYYPNSAGEWLFGLRQGPIGPGTNVSSTITNCRFTAYEL
jgi:hypothetical protein